MKRAKKNTNGKVFELVGFGLSAFTLLPSPLFEVEKLMLNDAVVIMVAIFEILISIVLMLIVMALFGGIAIATLEVGNLIYSLIF